MIDGVEIITMKRIPDDRGQIMHIFKSTERQFTQFGEVYCSTVFPGIIKGWHLHKKMTLNYVVIRGMIRFVLYDDREGSPSKGELQEIYIGDSNYVRVTVPPMLWNGFMGIGMKEAMVINFTDIPHDPEEILRLDPHLNHIGYKWKVVER